MSSNVSRPPAGHAFAPTGYPLNSPGRNFYFRIKKYCILRRYIRLSSYLNRRRAIGIREKTAIPAGTIAGLRRDAGSEMSRKPAPFSAQALFSSPAFLPSSRSARLSRTASPFSCTPLDKVPESL